MGRFQTGVWLPIQRRKFVIKMNRAFADFGDGDFGLELIAGAQGLQVIALDVPQRHSPVFVAIPFGPRDADLGEELLLRPVRQAEVIAKENNAFAIGFVKRNGKYKGLVAHPKTVNQVD